MKTFPSTGLLTTAALLALLHCSCREKGEVQHFRTPKAPRAEATAPAQQPPQTPATATKAPYTWTLPDGWTAQSASGMRLATILIPSGSGTLNASITEFGGDLAGNVNRWRGQIGLPPLQESAIAATLKEVETGLGKGYIVSLSNPASPDSGLLAAIIPRPTNTSVFIKVPGNPADLEKITAAFTGFTQSLAPATN
ncbi:MAG: hypothetical protein H7A51_15490 [Akkermansiaceae bacterium]|nr:hypothetical protein [Akkermansiaceae bacterium]